jgi:formylglycine-generating enzyme required for sulfatase activity
MRARNTGVLFVAMLIEAGGCVEQRCYENADCAAPQICNVDGQCVFECTTAIECANGFSCDNHVCVPVSSGPMVCPSDMVAVADAFCIDRYEASRMDATATTEGIDDSVAISVAGVLPWQVPSNVMADQACRASGKRLCAANEWHIACAGPERTAYGYGNAYEAATCNGIDTYGISSFHLMPTGSFPGCTNEWGAYDLNGNLWEHVAGGTDRTVRGGAFNCADSASLHRCDYVPGYWIPSALGFRCCLSPGGSSDAGGGLDGRSDDASGGSSDAVSGGADVGAEMGCIDIVPDGAASGQDANEDQREAPGNVDDGSGTDASGVVADGSGHEASAASTDAADEQTFDASGEPVDSEAPDVVVDAVDAEASVDAAPGCSAEMVRIGGFCIDVYEASRSDATAYSGGASTLASVRAGVIPWFPVTLAQARDGCASMGKRLCRPDEWTEACQGPSPTVYSYGNDYDPVACNGIDTFCNCSAPECSGVGACPYPHCFDMAAADGGGPCGSGFHVMPTGGFLACTNAHGVMDVNGNVWEIVDTTDGLEHFRGGAFNCSDSEMLHRCDYDATWNPSAKGFRCCTDWSQP